MSSPASDDRRFEAAREQRRKVLGDAHVERAEKAMSDFDAPFQAMITEMAWGKLWSGPGLTLRERSIVTIALLAALGHHEELALHVRATANTGASAEDVQQALLHVALYAGVPAANSAFRIAKPILDAASSNAAEGDRRD